MTKRRQAKGQTSPHPKDRGHVNRAHAVGRVLGATAIAFGIVVPVQQLLGFWPAVGVLAVSAMVVFVLLWEYIHYRSWIWVVENIGPGGGVQFAAIVALAAIASCALLTTRDLRNDLSCVRLINIDQTRGAVFNSYVDQPTIYPGHIRAENESWYVYGFYGRKQQIAFTYETTMEPAVNGESSGAYLTMYDDSFDLADYESLVFTAKTNGAGGAGDMGVRLVVDDRSAPFGQREIVVREISSLDDLAPALSNTWQQYEVDLAEFTVLDPYRRPLGDANPNRINKIVFFVDTNTVRDSTSGTIYVKDIRLQKACSAN